MNNKYIELEGRRVLPNGAVVQRSIYPKEQLEFNQWARELGVSSSYTPVVEGNRPMEMIREWGVKGVDVLGFM